MANAMTAARAFSQVQEAAEKIKNDEPATVGTVSRGDVVRQGDLYLVAITRLPESCKPTHERQLAPGTSQGSRHVLTGECEIFMADPAEVARLVAEACEPRSVAVPPELVGPVFRTLTEVTVTHPEHGDRTLPAGECFATVYQRAYADEVRRVAD